VVEQAIGEIGTHPEASAQEVDLILIAENLERVGDHATNIAEDVILAEEARNLKHAGKLGGSQV
jgi:phosphate transport system protein